jgi:ABC-type dipeptide/oligopeptide/nickel transport system ATPase component
VAHDPLLDIRDLAVSFNGVRAVDGLSLTVHPRQTLALVGESGCGKTVTALAVLRLVPCPAARIDRGAILYRGRDLLSLDEKQMRPVRGGEIAMIFQEPMTSLNPVYSVGDQIVEAVRLHRTVGRGAATDIAARALADVGIADARRRLRAYPHELSGGMCQRAMIAMALSCRPSLLLADEPSTALDVTVQAQILDLLVQLQRERDMALVLITHDLGVVARNADVVCVMYAGRAVEYARVGDLFANPRHPYTRGLFAAIPKVGDPQRRLTTVDRVVGDPGEFRQLPDHDRGVVPWWPAMSPPDGVAEPAGDGGGDAVLHEVEPEHWVACWRTGHLVAHPDRPPDIDFRRHRRQGTEHVRSTHPSR